MKVKELLAKLSVTTPRQADVALLGMRVSLGLMMAIGHGWGKITNLEKMGTVVAKHGMPEFMGALAALAEFGGGLLLAIGLLTRFSAGALAVTMLVAAFVIHGDDPFFKSGPGGFKEFALVYGAPFLFIAWAGPGKLSLDHLLFARGHERSDA